MDNREALARILLLTTKKHRFVPWESWRDHIKDQYLAQADAILASGWLTAHDREVEAKALEAAGQVMNADVSLFNAIEQCIATRGVGGANPIQDASVAWLEARAAALRSTPATAPEPTETNGEQR